jgi:hypothetical protein
MAMDALCSIFDAVACVGEVYERSEAKEQELRNLSLTVESISQSVRAFAGALPFEEKDVVFNSNKVWPELLAQLQCCDDVLRKYQHALQDTSMDEPGTRSIKLEDGMSAPRPVVSALQRTVIHGRSLANEGMQALSARVGSFGSKLFKLPEGELAVIKQASSELTKLVPLLHMAMFAGSSAQKRPNDDVSRMMAPPPQIGRHAAITDVTGGRPRDAQEELPELCLQLISEWRSVNHEQLPQMTARDLRPGTASVSSTSFNSDDYSASCFVIGRQELRDKVPKHFTMQYGNGQRQFTNFVSREALILEVLPPPPPLPSPSQDSQNAATLALGGGASEQAASQTLAWGGGDVAAGGAAAFPRSLAVVWGVPACGLHIRAFGEARWRWFAKNVKTTVYPGDVIALLLESPRNSGTPGPSSDLEASQASCLLGLDIRVPTGT